MSDEKQELRKVYHSYVPGPGSNLCGKKYPESLVESPRLCGQPEIMHITEPSLGFATTRELLEELRVRGQMLKYVDTAWGDVDSEHLEKDAAHLLKCLNVETLNERPMDEK